MHVLEFILNRRDCALPHQYLRNEADELPTRDSQDYAKDKLTILNGYMARFTTAMKDKPWRALNYVDLQAGPGKNVFDPSGEIMLGSPLLALTTRFAFDNLYFVEMGTAEYSALETRVSTSDRSERVELFHEDCNLAVETIVARIRQIDGEYVDGKWPCLNLAFLDPEGLEIEWQTVEKLAGLSRMDLIINFSTSGITRNAGLAASKEDDTKVDRFFGTREWRTVYEATRNQDSSVVRRKLIDFYLSRLNDMGYVETVPQEKDFKNQRNVQIYTMIFASKNDLGIRFWNGAVQEVVQPKLL
jgi:three-Cys-motif partner protein